MSDVQYPFIDVAVHERVSEAFAAGMAVVLFSPDLRSVSWANGRGAALFGFGSIYDFLDQGLDRGELMFRQVEPVARSLTTVGDRRGFTVRIASGFLRVAVQARCEMIRVQNKPCILLSVPVDSQQLTPGEKAARLIEGFDDPETHMAVLDEQGTILAQSGQFSTLALSVQTTRMLVSMVGNDRHRLVKRPISTAGGYLPAAIGQVSEDPSLNLLFVVGAPKAQAPVAAEPLSTVVATDAASDIGPVEVSSVQQPDYEDALSAVAAIEDNPDIEEEISLDATPEPVEADSGIESDVEADVAALAPAEETDIASSEAASVETTEDHGDMPDVIGDDDHRAGFEPEVMPNETAETPVSESAEDPAEDGMPLSHAPEEAIHAEVTEEDETGIEADDVSAATVEATAFEEPVEGVIAEEDRIVDDFDHAPAQEIHAETLGGGDDVIGDEDADKAVTDTDILVEASAPVADDLSIPAVEPEPASVTPDNDSDLTPSAEEKIEPTRVLKTVRFVWKIDASGRFSEVSREFADAVGPHAADISGMAFSDLAALFNLDPDGKIAELLSRRDTWSGRTIWWPVEGTSLVVPVDLAALPTYTRTREFDGFRGFGIVRMGDAAEDPNAAGLSLGKQQDDDGKPEGFADAMISAGATVAEEARETVTGDEATDTPAVEDHLAAEADGATVQDEIPAPEHDAALGSEREAAANDDMPGPAASGETLAAEATDDDATNEDVDAEDSGDETVPVAEAPESDRQEGERPALMLVDNPGRRHSDKVIRLEEHRSRLSPGEQANFQEIARRLDTFVKSAEETDVLDKDRVPETGSDEAAVTQDIPASSVNDEAPATHLTEIGEPASEPVDGDGDTSLPAAASEHEDIAPDDVPADQGEAVADDHGGDNDAQTLMADDAIAEPETADGKDAAVSASTEPVADVTDVVEPEEIETPDVAPPIDAVSRDAMLVGRDRIGLSEEIIDQMPVALLVHAGDRLIHANGEFLKMTGYPSLEVLADIGGLDALLQRQELEDKTTHAGGMVVVRADDAIVPVTARLQSIRWNDSSALMLALMPVAAAEPEQTDLAGAEVLPLRPLRNADQLVKLQVEVDELRAILETATDGVVIIGAEGDIRSLNRAASALFNFDGEEINGKPFVTLFAHESQRAIIDYLSGLAGHGVASVLNDGREVIGREASGGFIPLFMTIGRLTSSNGYCAVIRDITQWKRTEEELRTAKRAAETANAHKSEFLAHVSHEIRTPLNAIIGFADMMASERLGPVGHPRYIEYSNDIGRSGRHVLDIVNDLLDISKIEAGELDLDFISVGLNETVSEAVSLVQPQANGQRVIIRTALSQAVPQVVADLRSIKQIVLNVLSNAIRFTPSGGQIVVSTAYEANGSVVLRIRDTGIGMTRAELELAMKPFRQVAGASRKRGDGTGLGLPLTKAMVDANRANFSISSAPNEGTLVEITFPSQRVLAS